MRCDRLFFGDRLLLGPGPSNPYPEAIAALSHPVLGHLDPELLALVADTAERLRAVFGTRNRLTLPVSGTGSAGMEACLASLLEPGELAIVGVNGYFGERLCEHHPAGRAHLGAELTTLSSGPRVGTERAREANCGSVRRRISIRTRSSG